MYCILHGFSRGSRPLTTLGNRFLTLNNSSVEFVARQYGSLRRSSKSVAPLYSKVAAAGGLGAPLAGRSQESSATAQQSLERAAKKGVDTAPRCISLTGPVSVISLLYRANAASRVLHLKLEAAQGPTRPRFRTPRISATTLNFAAPTNSFKARKLHSDPRFHPLRAHRRRGAAKSRPFSPPPRPTLRPAVPTPFS